MRRICEAISNGTSNMTIIGLVCRPRHAPSIFYLISLASLLFLLFVSVLVVYFVLQFSEPSILADVASYYYMHIERFGMMLLIPILLLVIFDIIFVNLILPFLKNIVYPVIFDYAFITREMVFNVGYEHSSKHDHTSKIKRICSVPFSAREHYRFLLPRIFLDDEYNRVNIERYLKELSSLIWTVRLMQKPVKEYLFLLLSLIVFVAFFIFVHKFYYFEFMPHLHKTYSLDFVSLPHKSKYILVFLIIWIIYVIFRLKLITGTGFYIHHFQQIDTLNGSGAQFELNRIRAIYAINSEIYLGNRHLLNQIYEGEALQADVEALKSNNSNTERVIEFATAILAMLIAQFIV